MFVIRKAKPADNEAVECVHLRAIKEICASHYTPEEIEAWARPRKPNHYVESISNNEFYVAEENGDVVGFGALNQERGEIEAVYILPEVARRGIGLKILRKLEERARELGVKSLRLNSSLNATAFYKSAGYKPQEESKHRLSSGVEIGCVLMTKEISS
ncbi:MAG: GNAT family N-acetyltransferase [Acidobacteriota bacterium]|nr:GNAT family N-acetyltransferase [Acidobacteriota bacterium]